MVTSSPSKQNSADFSDRAQDRAQDREHESADLSSVPPISSGASSALPAEPPAKNQKRAGPQTRGSLREQKKVRARKLILDSAQTLIHELGYAQTKMRDVAVAADMSYQTLYNYFPTKGLILQELLTRDLLKLHRATFNILHGEDQPHIMLRDLAKAYIDAIDPDDRELWKEVCAELLKATSHHSCLLDLLDRQALNKLESALTKAQTKQRLDPHIEASTLAQVVFSLLDASLMRYLLNERISRAKMLKSVSAQLQFCITPYSC